MLSVTDERGKAVENTTRLYSVAAIIKSRMSHQVSWESSRCTEGASSMEPDGNKESRITALNKEMDAIYFADRQYWEEREGVTHDMRIEHQKRQERLEEIRKELTRLRSA
jgi:hypothetical protein